MSDLIFFLHIPKCSGSTLNYLIDQNYSNRYKVSWNEVDPRHYSNIIKINDSSIFGDSEVVSGHFPYGLHEVLKCSAGAKYITMLRDPIKRCVSTFNYLQYDSTYVNNNNKLASVLRNMNLKSFYSELHVDIPNHIYIDNCQVRYLSGVGGSKGFGEISNSDLDKAKHNLMSMTFGITEEFDKSILLFQNVLRWKNVRYVCKRVGSVSKEPLTEEESNILVSRNKYDIELYKFAENMFSERTCFITESALTKYKKSLRRYRMLSVFGRTISKLKFQW